MSALQTLIKEGHSQNVNEEESAEEMSFFDHQKLVTFCEEVTVVHIARKSQQETEQLFWHADDYIRMRGEDQIATTRRARSRVREMKRRLSENARVVKVATSQKGGSPGGSMDMYQHADSMRLTLDRVKTQQGLTCIANAA